MSGNIAARYQDWRAFFWLTVALAAFVTLLLVFAFPETKWQRDSVNHAGGMGNDETQSQDEKVVDSEASSQDAAGGKQVGKGKPNKTQFLPVLLPDSAWWKYVVRDITTPIMVFFNPIVFWVRERETKEEACLLIILVGRVDVGRAS
jgi:hypothetical protein